MSPSLVVESVVMLLGNSEKAAPRGCPQRGKTLQARPLRTQRLGWSWVGPRLYGLVFQKARVGGGIAAPPTWPFFRTILFSSCHVWSNSLMPSKPPSPVSGAVRLMAAPRAAFQVCNPVCMRCEAVMSLSPLHFQR